MKKKALHRPGISPPPETPRRPPPVMQCGCSGFARSAGRTCCPVHAPTPAAYRVRFLPDLSGRKAKCACGLIADSDATLPFFSMNDDPKMVRCKNCRSALVWHSHPTMKPNCPGFVPSDEPRFDSFYCGCRGWN